MAHFELTISGAARALRRSRRTAQHAAHLFAESKEGRARARHLARAISAQRRQREAEEWAAELDAMELDG